MAIDIDPTWFWTAGAGMTLLSSLLGVWLGSRLAYGFQKKLLRQQLEFQKEQGVADAALRKEISEEIVRAIKELTANTKESLAGVSESARRPPPAR